MFEVTGKYGFFDQSRCQGSRSDPTPMDQPLLLAQRRIMPDYHWGVANVGLQQLGRHIIPNLVGVDIGCGICWSLGKVNFDLKEFDHVVHRPGWL